MKKENYTTNVLSFVVTRYGVQVMFRAHKYLLFTYAKKKAPYPHSHNASTHTHARQHIHVMAMKSPWMGITR